ncbi:hypothetical protein MMC25_006403 [Agyrium rufum]|nr:hypothetical protein [Agyrium rufum]
MDRRDRPFRKKELKDDVSVASRDHDPQHQWWRRRSKKLPPKHDVLPEGMVVEARIDQKEDLSLWDQAYNSLKVKEQDLVQKYEILLSQQLHREEQGFTSQNRIEKTIDNADPAKRQSQLAIITAQGLERLEASKSVLNIAGHEFKVQEQIAQAAKFLEWGKKWVDNAVQASPQALAAWAAVCIALPLLTKPAAAEKANKDGFTYVTSRMRYYVALESLMLRQNEVSLTDESSQKLRTEFEAHVIDLYQQILDFQFRSVLRFYRGSLNNFGRDLTDKDDWEQMLKKVKGLERIVHDASVQISTLSSYELLRNSDTTSKESLRTMQNFLTVTNMHLQVGKDHRDLSAASLKVQTEALESLRGWERKALSTEEEKCLQIFRGIRPESNQPYEWYKNRTEDRVDGTCEWFLNQTNFQTWLKQDHGPLFVSADPGCGKSVLAKYLIDHELPRLTKSTICYFFFKDQIQNSLSQALCALLHQLFCAKPFLVSYALPEYRKNGPGLVENSIVLWHILTRATQDANAGHVIFVIDALDECDEECLHDLIQLLKDFYSHNGNANSGEQCRVRFLLTSRPYQQITTRFHELVSTFPFIFIPGEDESKRIGHEVNCVIHHRVEQLAKSLRLSPALKDHLCKRLLDINHRTYLWIYLVFDHIQREGVKKTEKGIEKLLRTLLETVSQAYEKILSRATDHAKVRKILAIILAAHRPLTLEEMNYAVNIEISPSSTCENDLDLELEDDFKGTLRNLCGLFVSIYHDKVYFLHQTAREFLVTREFTSMTKSTPSQCWHGAVTLEQAHAILAQICLTYLHFSDFVDGFIFGHSDHPNTYGPPLLDIEICLHKYPFLYYSAAFWAEHVRQACFRTEAYVTILALRACDPTARMVVNWFPIYRSGSLQLDDSPIEMTRLGMIAFLGLDNILRGIPNKDIELDAVDEHGRTALHWAVRAQQVAAVELLLERGAYIDVQDRWNQMALYIAVFQGDTQMAKLLLAKGAGYDIADLHGMTPLHVALEYGYPEVAAILSEKGASVASSIYAHADSCLSTWPYDSVVKM